MFWIICTQITKTIESTSIKHRPYAKKYWINIESRSILGCLVSVYMYTFQFQQVRQCGERQQQNVIYSVKWLPWCHQVSAMYFPSPTPYHAGLCVIKCIVFFHSGRSWVATRWRLSATYWTLTTVWWLKETARLTSRNGKETGRLTSHNGKETCWCHTTIRRQPD